MIVPEQARILDVIPLDALRSGLLFLSLRLPRFDKMGMGIEKLSLTYELWSVYNDAASIWLETYSPVLCAVFDDGIRYALELRRRNRGGHSGRVWVVRREIMGSKSSSVDRLLDLRRGTKSHSPSYFPRPDMPIQDAHSDRRGYQSTGL